MIADRAHPCTERIRNCPVSGALCDLCHGCCYAAFLSAGYPADLLHGALLKFAASLPCLTLALHQYLYDRNQFGRMIVLAMVFAMAADIAINISTPAGVILFGICHILFDIAFVKQQRPDRRALLL